MPLTLTQNQSDALVLLDATLTSNQIAYAIIGGLAAQFYGVERPLADIDIVVHEPDIKTVRSLLKEHIVTDLRHYQTEQWDITQMIIELCSTPIDVCGQENFMILHGGNTYVLPDVIASAASMPFNETLFPVIDKLTLTEYKRFIGRPVDRADLRTMNGQVWCVTET